MALHKSRVVCSRYSKIVYNLTGNAPFKLFSMYIHGEVDTHEFHGKAANFELEA